MTLLENIVQKNKIIKKLPQLCFHLDTFAKIFFLCYFELQH